MKQSELQVDAKLNVLFAIITNPEQTFTSRFHALSPPLAYITVTHATHTEAEFKSYRDLPMVSSVLGWINSHFKML